MPVPGVPPSTFPSRMLHDWTCTLVRVLWQLVNGWGGRAGAKGQGNPPAWLEGGVGVKLVHFPFTQYQQRFFISSKPKEIVMYTMTDSLRYVVTYRNGLRKNVLNLQALAESLGTALASLLDKLLFMACTWFKEQGLEGKGGGNLGPGFNTQLSQLWTISRISSLKLLMLH